MKANCRFPECFWSGEVKDLYKHCEMEHGKYVKEINDDNYCDLKFDKIHTDTFLLSGKEGLYWFIADRWLQNADGIRRGIFAIGDSEVMEYVILIGNTYSEFVASQGPFKTLHLKSKQFDMFWSFRQLMTHRRMKANRVRLIFFDLKGPRFFKWENFEDSTYSSFEHTCMTCGKAVQQIDHFCINGHCLCRRCLLKLQRKVGVETDVCPICPKSSFQQNCYERFYYSDEED